MNNHSTQSSHVGIRDYWQLCKPRVVALMVLTAVVAMLLAKPGVPLHWTVLLFAALGIALAAAAGASINHLVDWKIDAIMSRTQNRPIPAGRVQLPQAITLAVVLTASSSLILFTLVNTVVATLSLLALVGYAGLYTVLLKQSTSQNIVIGGLSGAMPPLLGWTAVTGHIEAPAILLVLIIFTWTPPHFWALAIHRHEDYARAQLPMLPVTHGIPLTKRYILLYTLLMMAMTYLAFAVHLFGLVYLLGVSLLNAKFLYHVLRLYREEGAEHAMPTFHYSIVYLGLLFLLMVVDRCWPIVL